MVFSCSIDSDGDLKVVRARGEIDVSSSARFSRCLQRALKECRGGVLLDLRDVTFIDAYGLGLIDRFFQECRDGDHTFALAHVSPFVQRLLRIVGFDQVLPILDSHSADADGREEPRSAGT
jgi:anti-sigma B factor antagonist